MQNVRELDVCRMCGGTFYLETVKLKDSPLANELYPTKESALLADTFALEIVMCTKCKHIQLKHIVDPGRLFSDYIYASGTSTTFQNHFSNLAKRIVKLVPEGTALEIGSNDGTLLEALREKGLKTIGVEPSEYLANMSRSKSDFIYHDFLDASVCQKIIEKHGFVDVVVGNNVFAHIDDLMGAFKHVLELLKNNGYFIFEVAHVLSLVQNHLFDTVYHEHMSYHSIISLEPLLNEIGFDLIEVEEIETHGGSIRIICQKSKTRTENSKGIQEILLKEEAVGLGNQTWMKDFNGYMQVLRHKTEMAISSFPTDTVWFGYGAPAKAVTFINEFDLGSLKIIGIVDDNFEKQGKFLPVTSISVISKSELMQKMAPLSSRKDYACIIFPWNLSEEILGKLPSIDNGRYRAVWFLPTFRERRIDK